jgi:hypothetical protein
MSILGIDASLKNKENDIIEENTTCDGNQSPKFVFMYPIILQSLIFNNTHGCPTIGTPLDQEATWSGGVAVISSIYRLKK